MGLHLINIKRSRRAVLHLHILGLFNTGQHPALDILGVHSNIAELQIGIESCFLISKFLKYYSKAKGSATTYSRALHPVRGVSRDVQGRSKSVCQKDQIEKAEELMDQREKAEELSSLPLSLFKVDRHIIVLIHLV